MQNGNFNVAWVLGAGFSRFLGGPLLDDFFSVPVRQRVMARTPTTELQDRFDWLHRYYRSEDIVVKRRDGHWPHPWKNAEDFSELLETAALRDDPDAALRAQATLLPYPTGAPPIPWQDYESWATVCRQYLAAACHEFVDEPASVRKLERWAPYRNWAKNVWPRDTIVSFNYDLVVERVCGGTKFEAILPTRHNYPGNQPSGVVQLLKLHGSANWARPDAAGPVAEQDPFEILRQNESPLIATPGPRKLGMIADVMEPLWHGAVTELWRAHVVVFVGYRFPESDVEAKKRLLEALAQNQNEELVIRIVLGPNVAHEDVRRLRGLLDWGLRPRRLIPGRTTQVVVEPMWAQDFFSVFSREGLAEPSPAQAA